MKIAVFGSASPRNGDALYQMSFELGDELGKRGHTLITGGYCGTMEATLKGALQHAGVHTIGVTCEEIEAYRPGRANAFVREEVKTTTLNERIDYLTRHADAFFVLPGGIGTLAEAMMTFNLMVIGAIQTKPFILIGEAWASVFKQLFEKQAEHIPAFAQQLPLFVNSVPEAVLALEKHINE